MPKAKRKVVKPRVARTRGNNTMTEAGFWSFIRSGLRAKSQRWPPKYAVLNECKRTVTGKRHRFEHQCSECNKWHPKKNVEVDHILPAGSLKGLDDLAGFVDRLFCEIDGLRVLCKPCHLAITKKEKKK